MCDPRATAAAYGVGVEITDLGDWAATTLISEYDPQARVIRVNARALEAYRRARGELTSCAVRTFIDLAIAHELYHHREAIGEVPRLGARVQREAAADAFARTAVPADARLDAFLAGRIVR